MHHQRITAFDLIKKDMVTKVLNHLIKHKVQSINVKLFCRGGGG